MRVEARVAPVFPAVLMAAALATAVLQQVEAARVEAVLVEAVREPAVALKAERVAPPEPGSSRCSAHALDRKGGRTALSRTQETAATGASSAQLTRLFSARWHAKYSRRRHKAQAPWNDPRAAAAPS